MKRIDLILLLVLVNISVFSQSRVVDSLNKALSNEKTDTGKIILLYNLSHTYQDSQPDSALLLGREAYELAKKIKFLKGESWGLSQMAIAFNSMGNFPKALVYYIEQLKIEEERERPDNIASIYLNIALVYTDTKDYEKALVYSLRADSIINVNNFNDLSLYSLLNVGDIYQKANVLDSALAYTQRCYAKAIEAGNDLIVGTALNNLGNIYFKTGDFTQAFNNYKSGLPYLQLADDLNTYTEGVLGLAKVFERNQQHDSAIGYAKQSYAIASQNQFMIRALDAGLFLSQVYKKLNIDSAYKYQEILVGLKDSIYSREKIRDVQNLTSAEQLRQLEIVRLKKAEKKDRSVKLQLLMIGIAIPIFFLMSVVISRKKVNKKMIEFSGIISILLLFEYITLLLHPFVAEKSNHSPLIEIIVFVAIAAIITPSHHKIEHWLIAKLTQLNYLKYYKPEPEPAPEPVTDPGPLPDAEPALVPAQNKNINEEEIK